MRTLLLVLAVFLALQPALAQEAVIKHKGTLANSGVFDAPSGAQVRDIYEVYRGARLLGEAMVFEVKGHSATLIQMASFQGTLAPGDRVVFKKHASMPVASAAPSPTPSPQASSTTAPQDGRYPPPRGVYGASHGQGTYPPPNGQGAYPPPSGQGSYPPPNGQAPNGQGTYPPPSGQPPSGQGTYPPPNGQVAGGQRPAQTPVIIQSATHVNNQTHDKSGTEMHGTVMVHNNGTSRATHVVMKVVTDDGREISYPVADLDPNQSRSVEWSSYRAPHAGRPDGPTRIQVTFTLDGQTRTTESYSRPGQAAPAAPAGGTPPGY
jgi:hypothetical protein